MSEGAITSQPACGLVDRLLAQDFERFIVDDVSVAQQAVVTVARVRVEGHVADDAQIGTRLFHRADALADEVLGIERFVAVGRLFRRVGRREEGDGGNSQLGRLARPPPASRSTESRSTPGIEGIGVRLPVPSCTKMGQIKSSTLSRFSATSRRDQAVRRFRRMRVDGNRPGSEGRRGMFMGFT